MKNVIILTLKAGFGKLEKIWSILEKIKKDSRVAHSFPMKEANYTRSKHFLNVARKT